MPPQTSTRPASRGGTNQKALIRAAAAELFASRGYHATGIEEISQAVGLGRGALYHHIGSKEQLLYEISSAGIEEIIEGAQEVLESDRSAVEKLRAMSCSLMRIIADNRPELTVLFREIDLMSPEYRDALVSRRSRYQAQWSQAIEEGVAAGELRPVDPAIVMGILGMHNYSYLWMRRDGRLSPEELADLFMSTLLDGLRAEA